MQKTISKRKDKEQRETGSLYCDLHLHKCSCLELSCIYFYLVLRVGDWTEMLHGSVFSVPWNIWRSPWPLHLGTRWSLQQVWLLRLGRWDCVACGPWDVRLGCLPPRGQREQLQSQTNSLQTISGKNGRKTAIELVVSLSSASIHDKNCQVSVNKTWFYTREKTKNSCYFTRKEKRNTQLYLFPFLGLTLLVYLLLPWRSNVAAELQLNCLFVHLFAWFRTHYRQAKRATPDEGVHLPRTNKRRRKHGVCASLSRTLHRANFTVCIWIVRGPSVAAARTLMESEC